MTSSQDGRWHPGIGDPNATGWITVAAYASAMLLCYLCQRKVQPGPARQFWWCMALTMAALGLNKQLDLQTWFTEVGRDLSLQYGWYARRRTVQAVFIGALLVAGLVARSWLLQRLKGLDAYARRAASGLVVLGLFVLVRATSFHHVDALLGFSIENIRLNVVLELSGIVIIAIAAWGRLRTSIAKP
jgi:hypothetical protein